MGPPAASHAVLHVVIKSCCTGGLGGPVSNWQPAPAPGPLGRIDSSSSLAVSSQSVGQSANLLYNYKFDLIGQPASAAGQQQRAAQSVSLLIMPACTEYGRPASHILVMLLLAGRPGPGQYVPRPLAATACCGPGPPA